MTKDLPTINLFSKKFFNGINMYRDFEMTYLGIKFYIAMIFFPTLMGIFDTFVTFTRHTKDLHFTSFKLKIN